MHPLHFSADCFRGFCDGGPIEGLFYLDGPAPSDFPATAQGDHFESAWSRGRKRTETIASVDAFIALAQEPGDDAEVLTLTLPLHDDDDPNVQQDRHTDRVKAYFQGRPEGVITRELLIRRLDVREMATQAVQSQVTEAMETLWNLEDVSVSQALHRALALRAAVTLISG